MSVKKSGKYTIASIEKIRIAKNGWRVWLLINMNGIYYREDAVYFYEYFNTSIVGERYFIKVIIDSQKNKIKKMKLIPLIQVPDSIESAPANGWSEAWMKEHFPKVVEYVHDTR